MGITYAPLKLINPSGDRKSVEVTAMADSGAAMVCIPSEIADELSLEKNGQVREVTVADGRKIQAPYVGPLEVWFEDRHC